MPDSEIALGFLWKKLYKQIHLALVEVKNEDNLVSIGVSFPKYSSDRFLGDTLRLFGFTKEDLEDLKLSHWLGKIVDYLIISEIQNVPCDISEYVTFSRKQFKTNVERLARRQAKRKGISFEEALKNYENFKEAETKLPFIMMESMSTGNQMKIFIEKTIKSEFKDGKFSTYGLSKTATVPWF